MTSPRAARWVGVYGERYAILTPLPSDEHGTLWSAEVDGDPVWEPGERFVSRDDAMRAAESHVGARLDWREEE